MGEGPDEIEITPAMVQAGVEAYEDYLPQGHYVDDLVARVFRAMTAVQPRAVPHEPKSRIP